MSKCTRGLKVASLIWSIIMPIIPIGGFVFTDEKVSKIIDGCKIVVILVIISLSVGIVNVILYKTTKSITATTDKINNEVNDAIKGKKYPTVVELGNEAIKQLSEGVEVTLGLSSAIGIMGVVFIGLWLSGIVISSKQLACLI